MSYCDGRGKFGDLPIALCMMQSQQIMVQVNPSRDAYWKFGNTAVASTWYILARIESQGLVKKGDRLWQIGKHTPL